MKFIAFFVLLSALYSTAFAETIITVRGQEHKGEPWPDYPYKVIEQALKLTEEKYGPYRIEVASVGANASRVEADVKSGVFPNYFMKQAFTDAYADAMVSFPIDADSGKPDDLIALPFPIDLGTVGIRIGLVSTQTAEKLKSVTTLSELKKFSMVQGAGWADARVLRQQGFTVDEGVSSEAMAKMVASNRSDVFFRGMNEILDEWSSFKDTEDLAVDKSVAISYPLPKLFFTRRSSAAAAQRIYEGLKIAFDKGLITKLWETEHKKEVDFVNLDKRKVFCLDNPVLSVLPEGYEKYQYIKIDDCK